MIADTVGVSRLTVQNDRTELAKSGRLPKERGATVGKDGKRRKIPRKNPYEKRVTVRSKGQYAQTCKAIDILGDDIPSGRTTAQRLNSMAKRKERREEAIAASATDLTDDAIQLFTGDFRDLPVEPRSVDLIFTDVVWFEKAADDWYDLSKLAAEKWLKPGGYLCSYIGQKTLLEFCNRMTEYLNYEWQIGVKFQSRGSRSTDALNTNRIYSSWRPIAAFSNSAGRNIRHARDVPRIYDWLYAEKYETTYHAWQQPLEPTRDVIRMLCPHGGLVCDPFMGTGTMAVDT
ncbi:MAG: hypothetical protein CMJ78_16180 [Planctomycetaceae bacterium]|nr:hypothetical protein [Planctomycetaceae bacterium]